MTISEAKESVKKISERFNDKNENLVGAGNVLTKLSEFLSDGYKLSDDVSKLITECKAYDTSVSGSIESNDFKILAKNLYSSILNFENGLRQKVLQALSALTTRKWRVSAKR